MGIWGALKPKLSVGVLLQQQFVQVCQVQAEIMGPIISQDKGRMETPRLSNPRVGAVENTGINDSKNQFSPLLHKSSIYLRPRCLNGPFHNSIIYSYQEYSIKRSN